MTDSIWGIFFHWLKRKKLQLRISAFQRNNQFSSNQISQCQLNDRFTSGWVATRQLGVDDKDTAGWASGPSGPSAPSRALRWMDDGVSSGCWLQLSLLIFVCLFLPCQHILIFFPWHSFIRVKTVCSDNADFFISFSEQILRSSNTSYTHQPTPFPEKRKGKKWNHTREGILSSKAVNKGHLGGTAS